MPVMYQSLRKKADLWLNYIWR